MADYKNCEDCGEKVLSGDIRYCENSAREVCEYCYDSYLESGEESYNGQKLQCMGRWC